MLLELGKFASLLLSILCLCAMLHSAFFMLDGTFPERILESLKMLLLAACACWASGWIFRSWEQKAGLAAPRVLTTLPMRMLFWAVGGITLLFLVSWYIEAYYLPLRRSLGGG